MSFVFGVTSIADSYELYTHPLYEDENLIAYYRLENANATIGENLTNYSETAFASAVFSNGASFPDNNTVDFLASSTSLIGSTTAFTISVWAQINTQITDFEAAPKYMFVMDDYLDGPPYAHLGIFYEYNGGSPRVACFISNYAGNWTQINLTGQLTVGQTYHFAMTFDGSNTIKGYADGEYIGSGTWVNSPTQSFGDASGFYIGGSYWGVAHLHPMRGYLDDVALFDRELTADEVASLYDYTPPAIPPTQSVGFGSGINIRGGVNIKK